jgi:hypothetical protein
MRRLPEPRRGPDRAGWQSSSKPPSLPGPGARLFDWIEEAVRRWVLPYWRVV